MEIRDVDLETKVTLSILGRSGCGKGTQAQFLLKNLEPYGVHHIETGRFLRAALKHPNVTTRIGSTLMQKGKSFPEWFVIFTWLKEFIEKGCGAHHLIFDGAPRRLGEAKLLDAVLKWHGRPLALCIAVQVSKKEAVKRLLARGRADDTHDAIENRMRYFAKDVVQVLRYYQREKRLIKVDGEQEPEEIARDIRMALKERLGRLWPFG